MDAGLQPALLGDRRKKKYQNAKADEQTSRRIFLLTEIT